MKTIYYLGGSPCCGKSTIAEMISNKFNLQYYKADDFLMDFITKGAEDGDEWLKHVSEMSSDQLWLREPEKLNAEELLTYKHLFPYFTEAINKLNNDRPIIAEGAAFLPSLIEELNINKNRYVCIVPTKDFQVKHYSERDWIAGYLSDCSDADKAFSNWMDRDHLFALSVLGQAEEKRYMTLIVDGVKNIEENVQFILDIFELK